MVELQRVTGGVQGTPTACDKTTAVPLLNLEPTPAKLQRPSSIRFMSFQRF